VRFSAVGGDLSTFVHSTRDWTETNEAGEVAYAESAAESLEGVIRQRRLIAVKPVGFALRGAPRGHGALKSGIRGHGHRG
jgi:hypothetical protein